MNLRIAMFGQKRIPSREGGVEIVVEELCTRLVQLGYEVTCLNRSGHHVSGAEYDKVVGSSYKGIRLKTVPTIQKKGLAAVTSSFFAALHAAFGPYDVVHIHAEGPAFFCWLPKLFGKKVVCTIHGIDWNRAKWNDGIGAKFILQGEKNAVRFADDIIVLSKNVQNYFKNRYGRDTVFIPNGVSRPIRREAEQITRQYGLQKDGYLLFLARLVPEKRADLLIDAFKQTATDKKLVIAGGSSDSDEYMSALKRHAGTDDRLVAGEEIVDDGLPDDADRRGSRHIARRERFAVFETPLVDVEIFLRAGFHAPRRPVQRAVNRLHGRAAHHGRGGAHGRAFADDGIAILARERDARAGAHRDARRAERLREDEQHVRAHVGNRRGDLLGGAIADFHHRNDGRNADDDAEHRQQRARDVAPQRDNRCRNDLCNHMSLQERGEQTDSGTPHAEGLSGTTSPSRMWIVRFA